MIPDWLPTQLTFPGGSLQADIDKLYAVYEADFINAPASIVDGSPVYVNTHPDPVWDRKYPHGFTHIITRGDDVRGIDYNRASKLPWVKAILENYTQPEVTAFWDHNPSRDTLYLWLADLDFVIILRPKDDEYIISGQKRVIITAFCIDQHWQRKDLQKKYGRSFRQLGDV